MSNVEPLRKPRVRSRSAGGGYTLGELGRRMDEVENDLDGVSADLRKLTNRITMIGMLLSGAFIGSGILDGKAVEVLRAIILGG